MRDRIVRPPPDQRLGVVISLIEVPRFDFIGREISGGADASGFEREGALIGSVRTLVSGGSAPGVNCVEVIAPSEGFPRWSVIWIEGNGSLEHCDRIFIGGAVVRHRHAAQI